MKRIYGKLVLVSLLLVTCVGSVPARECTECKRTNAKKAVVQSKAAACKRAQSTAELNINNVRALINGYGNMWYDGSNAQYHLPKNSNTCPLFCAALWIGGTDVNDQIRIAALRFGSEGDDYWPGPLKINGTASVDLPICNAYDKHWIITQSEVLALKEHFSYEDSTVVRLSDPQEAITDVILNWPAHGAGEDLTNYLAPFYDADGDGVYNPYNGDYPYYDFDNKLCPRTIKRENPKMATVVTPSMEETHGASGIKGSILSDQVLKGDQTIWWVFNDMGNTHTETQGQPIGLEIRAQAFAFSTNDRINDMTFYSYEIINRSTYELRETYFSQWVDPDLGAPRDDYVGCDVRRGLGYCYNGQPQDTPGSGSYSGIPPAVGIDFFQGPYMDPDYKDNPKIDIPKIQSVGSAPMKQLLASYEKKDDAGNFIGYDTIEISYDADKFDPQYWYFVPGDAIGNCAINGVNFGNGIVDDERFGMRRFVYYNNSTAGINSEPRKASDYYNYLRGYWNNGQRMTFGGNGIDAGGIPCDFMFPGDSDPWRWGTDGVVPDELDQEWTEITAGNQPEDRRFMQSAGPFTLKPGALNYITVGIPFAQATSGDQWTSVTLLRQIDDVCQALFENCFKVLDGPEAPTMTAQELSNEVILYLNYENPNSNNYGEKYQEIDPGITSYYIDDNGVTHTYDNEQLMYKFEGYQIFQLKDASTSIADIDDPTKAILVAQCDIENYYDTLIIESSWDVSSGDSVLVFDTTENTSPSLPIGTLVNYTTNTETGILTGRVMVQGANRGIQHVFRITKDMFATGLNNNLVNNKEYYFIAIAYAHNRFKEYSQTDAAFLDGQKEPYLAGRKNEKNGGSITPITVIPHSPSAEYGGSVAQAEFGMSPNIIRLGGYGNGGSILRLTQASIDSLMGAPGQPAKEPGVMTGNFFAASGIDRYTMSNPCIIANPMYQENYGPINVRVIDPLKVKEGRFNVLFWNEAYDRRNRLYNDSTAGVTRGTRWCVVHEDGSHFDSNLVDGRMEYVDTIWSDFSLGRYNEQLFLDLGIAITLTNPNPIATDGSVIMGNTYEFWGGIVNTGAVLGSSMTFADSTKQWLAGIPDDDNSAVTNWVRSGTQFSANSYTRFVTSTSPYSINEPYLDEDYFRGYLPLDQNGALPNTEAVDKNQDFESVVYGLWAPYGLTSSLPFHPAFNYSYYMSDDDVLARLGVNKNRLQRQLMVNMTNKSLYFNNLAALPSVRIVLTSDTTKWTRCPVVEMCDDHTQSEGGARRFSARCHASVDKQGRTLGRTATAADLANPNSPAYIADSGMGWFPGYAINTVTGERLNIMFGEDSRYVQHKGADMLWNPVSIPTEGTQNYVMGGRHYIYVMNATKQPFYRMVPDNMDYTTYYYTTPSYDAGRWAISMLNSTKRLMKMETDEGMPSMKFGIARNVILSNMIPTRDSIALLYASTAWVNMPLTSSSRYEFENPMDMPCDVAIDIDVRVPYGTYMSRNNTTSQAAGTSRANHEMPAYQFVMGSNDAAINGLATRDNARQEYIDSLLGLINVVPNPYYSYSSYETASQLETKVRIVNLPIGVEDGKPQGCLIRIYTVDGTLVRTIGPTSIERELVQGHQAEVTSVDWDLHNQTGIPIAGGMYLIHVSVPGIGERVIKWFGTMRPVDLNSFQF